MDYQLFEVESGIGGGFNKIDDIVDGQFGCQAIFRDSCGVKMGPWSRE